MSRLAELHGSVANAIVFNEEKGSARNASSAPPPHETLSLRTAFEAMNEAKRHQSPYTLRSRTSRFAHFFRENPGIEATPLSELSTAQISVALNRACHSPTVFNDTLGALSALYTYAMRKGWCTSNPLIPIDRRHVTEKEIHPLMPVDLSISPLQDLAGRARIPYMHMKAFIPLALGTGAAWGGWHVSDADLLAARQERGAAELNRSAYGEALRVAGDGYTEGIGTYAAGMVPLTVPEQSAALSGACGVDDGAGQDAGGVVFRVLSGSSVLWSSPEMKRGAHVQEFKVTVPQGARRLYLVTEATGDGGAPADWVNLKWEAGAPASPPPADEPVQMKGEDFGLTPGEEDATKAMQAMLNAAREKRGSVKIVLKKGEYHFHEAEALRMSFYASNHDQPAIRPVAVPLVDLENVEIDGGGSTFIIHGMTQPVLVMDSQCITLSNLSIALSRPWGGEAVIVSAEGGGATVSIDTDAFPCEIRGDRLFNRGEGWSESISCVMAAFRKDTGRIAAADIPLNSTVEALRDGTFRFPCFDAESLRLAPGDVLVLRSYAIPSPGVMLYRARNTVLNNVFIAGSMGKALLAQRSENVTILGGGCASLPGKAAVHTADSDAAHFSNTKGLIRIEGALFEGMMDDAANVHATCLGIVEVKGDRTILCRYMHRQAVGFEIFLPGERLTFIAGKTLENGETAAVTSVRKLDSSHLLITLDRPVPAGIGAGDAVENADWHPSVIFRRNIVRNNRARGILITTPGETLIEDNLFDHSSGSAILLAGDAQNWYESGACRKVTIRNNRFIHNLTWRYQFTDAIISIHPSVSQIEKQKSCYHSHIDITGNSFITHDVPLLSAISAENLSFAGNRVQYTDAYPGWGKKPFILKKCRGLTVTGNTTNRPAWTQDDCERDARTPADSIRIEKNTRSPHR